jgi:hypothetical protein
MTLTKLAPNGEAAEKLARLGVPLNHKVIEDLRAIAKQLGMGKPF